MVYNLTKSHSILGEFVAEIRDKNIQTERQRFRYNLERIGEIIAYEISKQLDYKSISISTPLATAKCNVLAKQPVLATILRAGMAMHVGLLNYFDKADTLFVSAYRHYKSNGSFNIKLEYVSGPSVKNRILIISDPMLATGLSLVAAMKEIFKKGEPEQIHIVCAIASEPGLEYVEKKIPHANIWAAAVDKILDHKSYIVPGLGDAGDLAFGDRN